MLVFNVESNKEEQELTDAGAILDTSIKWWKVKASICMGELQVLEEKSQEATSPRKTMRDTRN